MRGPSSRAALAAGPAMSALAGARGQPASSAPSACLSSMCRLRSSAATSLKKSAKYCGARLADSTAVISPLRPLRRRLMSKNGSPVVRLVSSGLM